MNYLSDVLIIILNKMKANYKIYYKEYNIKEQDY